MTYNFIHYSESKLWAYDPITKGRVEFKPEERQNVEDLIYAKYGHPKEGEVYPCPDGFTIAIEKTNKSCPHPCEDYNEICQYHGCSNVEQYALLLPIREELELIATKRTFIMPGDKVRMKGGEILTVKSLEYTEFYCHEKKGLLLKNDIESVLEVKKEDQPAKPEPTRKLALDELIKWLTAEIGFINDNDSIPDKFARQAYKNTLVKAQSLRTKEEENITEAWKDGSQWGMDDEGRQAKKYLTQTYNTPKP